MIAMEYRSGPDRNHPEWAKPLAPLPEWLESIEELLKSVDRANAQHPSSPIIQPRSGHGPECRRGLPHDRCNWMKSWRKRRSITRRQAAAILGYDSAAVIARIEASCCGEKVRPDVRRQRKLAERRWGEPIPDRKAWLKTWRARIGIYQWAAAKILGYAGRFAISRIENNHFVPAWEKILVAIDAEKATAAGVLLFD